MSNKNRSRRANVDVRPKKRRSFRRCQTTERQVSQRAEPASSPRSHSETHRRHPTLKMPCRQAVIRSLFATPTPNGRSTGEASSNNRLTGSVDPRRSPNSFRPRRNRSRRAESTQFEGAHRPTVGARHFASKTARRLLATICCICNQTATQASRPPAVKLPQNAQVHEPATRSDHARCDSNRRRRTSRNWSSRRDKLRCTA